MFLFHTQVRKIFILTFKLVFKYLPKLRIFKSPLDLLGYNSFINLFTSLFSISTILFNTIGYRNTLRLFYNVRRLILAGHANSNVVQNFISFSDVGMNRLGSSILLPALTPYWNNCMSYPKLFSKLFNIFMIINYLGIFGYTFKLTKFIIKFSLGSLVTSIGVLWSESLQTISYLKDFAYLIKDSLDQYFDIKIPTIKTGIDLPSDNTSAGISMIGLIILGVLGTITLFCVFDYFKPESLTSIPYLGDFIHLINSNITSLVDWMFGRDLGGSSDSMQTPVQTPVQTPEQITRSSSTGSEITIRDLRTRNSPMITPPSSRPETPFDDTPIASGSNLRLEDMPVLPSNWD